MTSDDKPEPEACPLCGNDLEEIEEAGEEPGVMTVYEIACSSCNRQMGVTVPQDDVQSAAERFKQRQQRRQRRYKGGPDR
jgi:hypothetical protein